MKLGEARIPIMMFKSRQTTHGAWIPWEKAHRGLDDGITDLAWLPTGEEYPAYLQCFDTKMVDTELLREALNNLGISLYDWWIYCDDMHVDLDILVTACLRASTKEDVALLLALV